MKALAPLAVFALALVVPAPREPKYPLVVLETNHGSIVLELYPDKAPATVKNFLDYVDGQFYDGTIFHRVIADFVIQGGGYDPGLKEKKTNRPPVKNESDNGLKNERGTIAAARTSEPNSATCQFYINVKDNAFLDPHDQKIGWTVFGRVIEGMETVDRIRRVNTATRGTLNDVPTQDVVIRTARRRLSR